MTGLAILALVACVVWLVRRGGPGRSGPQYTGALPNTIRQPINQAELTRAEEDLTKDPRPRSLGDQAEAEDNEDWGPGTGR